MAFLYWLEALAGTLFAVALLTEVALPLASGRPLFPASRWWRRSKALADAQDAVDEAASERQLERLRKRAVKMSPGKGGEEIPHEPVVREPAE